MTLTFGGVWPLTQAASPAGTFRDSVDMSPAWGWWLMEEGGAVGVSEQSLSD